MCAFVITITNRADDDALRFSATAVGKGTPRLLHVNSLLLTHSNSFSPPETQILEEQ